MKKLSEVLPKLDIYLKGLEPICKEFPICCQESSIILFIWLTKNGIDCRIIAGDVEDPVIHEDSIHFWIETEELIVDGTSVQFLLPNYDYPRKYSEIKGLIQQTDFLCEKTNKMYKNKVEAYIHKWLQDFMYVIIENTSDIFDDFIDEVKGYFEQYRSEIVKANRFMMLSSLCKNNMLYYELSYEDFLLKCFSQGIIPYGYIDEQYVLQ